ncbi:MAG: DUF6132 family protein [Candidatus Marinimicrobia bacterium]|nr:DUF6132 family protein [Candidatus Neomarinimicrobiota bacterium]
MNNIISFITSNKIIIKILTTAAGAGLGYLYYKFIGCRTGTCPITSNPWISMIWGGLIGFFLAG